MNLHSSRFHEVKNFLLFVIILALVLSAFWIFQQSDNPLLNGIDSKSKIIIGTLIVSIYSYFFSRFFSDVIVMQKDMEIAKLSNYFKSVPDLCRECRQGYERRCERYEKIHEDFIKLMSFKNLFEQKQKGMKDSNILSRDDLNKQLNSLGPIVSLDIKKSVVYYLDRYDQAVDFLGQIRER